MREMSFMEEAFVAEAEAWAWGVDRGCQGPLVECLAMTCLEKAGQ